jgi:hypothetical protein
MRMPTIALVGIVSLPILACGGGDLLLPSSGQPSQLRLVSGDLQQAQTGATLPDPLVVEAVDANGRPVAGSRILFRFELDPAGAQVSPDTAETNASGRAAAQVRLGGEAGGQPVEAVVVDGPSGLRVRFLLTAIAPNPGGGDDGGGDDGGEDGGDGDGGNGGEGGGDGGDGDGGDGDGGGEGDGDGGGDDGNGGEGGDEGDGGDNGDGGGNDDGGSGNGGDDGGDGGDDGGGGDNGGGNGSGDDDDDGGGGDDDGDKGVDDDDKDDDDSSGRGKGRDGND